MTERMSQNPKVPRLLTTKQFAELVGYDERTFPCTESA